MSQIFMAGRVLATPLEFGCIRLERADALSLAQLVPVEESGDLTLTLWGDCPAPWDGTCLVMIRMFQLPAAQGPLDEVLAWFGKDRKPRPPRLPDGVVAEAATLALASTPEGWAHSWFATSNRSLLHVYRSESRAVVLRFLAQSGTLLDHPLLAHVARHLEIEPGAWRTEIPAIREAGPSGAATAGERPLSAEVLGELAAVRATAAGLLGLQAGDGSEAVATAVHAYLESAPRGKRVAQADTGTSLALAVAWADAVCAAYGWTWIERDEDGSSEFLIASADRAFAINPMQVITAVRSSRRAANNSLLLFHMLAAGSLPAAPAGAWLRLG